MSPEPSFLWYTETASPYEHHNFSVKSFLFTGRTAFQDVAIVDSHEYGKLLIIDGDPQSAEDDEYIYHEALVHPAMLTHPDPRRVLIVGGGEGATLREVVRHRPVERVVMVDIDQELVELCQKLLPEWHAGAFQDPRVEVIFADGKDYIERTERVFDVILIDGCDTPVEGPALSLYTEGFYRDVRTRLAPGGLLVVQAMELCGLEYRDHLAVRDTLLKVFPLVRSYSTFIPSFWSEWGFLIASDGLDPAGIPHELLAERLGTSHRPGATVDLAAALKFYDVDTHFRMFGLPKDVRAALAHKLAA